MMKVDFSLSPTCVAMLGQSFDQTLVVLLGGIEIRVHKRAAVMIAPLLNRLRIFPRPPLQPPLLLGEPHSLISILRIDGRLKMVSQRENQMHRPARAGLQPAPSRSRQH